MTETLAVIDAPHFYAGIVLRPDRHGVERVVEAANIVHWMKKRRMTRDEVRAYCAGKGWKVSVVSTGGAK